MNFTQYNPNGNLEGFCVIKSVEKRISQKGSYFLDMVLCDASGEIAAKLWDYKETMPKFSAYDFVKVRGSINRFNDQDQFRIDRIRHVLPEDGVSLDDYVANAGVAGEVMLRSVEKTVEAFENEELKKLVTAVISANRAKLLYWPAAKSLHHAIRGGLLMHTLSILRMAEAVAAEYSCVNKDLLYAGIILHDIAKTEEIDSNEAGLSSEYSTRGNLLGHLVMGAIEVDRIGREAGVSEEILNLIEHMLISHHGNPEYGAAKLPGFIEAEILSLLDLLDARMFIMQKAVEGVEPGQFTNKIFAMDNIKLYNHGMNGEYKVNFMDFDN